MNRFLVWGALLLASCGLGQLKSPGGQFVLNVEVVDSAAVFSVPGWLPASVLGIETSEQQYKVERIASRSKVTAIEKHYPLHGKTARVDYTANEQVYTFACRGGATFEVVFRLSDDGVAFAYRLPGEGSVKIINELTYWQMPEDATGFLTPLSKAGTGWAHTNPSYEEHYLYDIPHGTPSPTGQGWTYPALFRLGDRGWALLSETGTDGGYAATRLSDKGPGSYYKVEFPHPDQGLAGWDEKPTVKLPCQTPWRMAVLSRDLQGITASTMAQDLVDEVCTGGTYLPGRASWSWVRLKDGSMNWDEQLRFVDFAAQMGWEYTLVDGYWDQNIGRERIAELVKYADAKGVKLILWYNSNGNWNDADQTPQNCMDTPQARQKEMEWLRDTGIKGIKVDFFGGDKQTTMQLYEDILLDACRYGIAVNFHGATLPRGWDRMYPCFATTEAVMGMEYVTFDQRNADRQPNHCAMLPFSRNVVAPMDFTPVMLGRFLGTDSKSGVERRTSQAFELALPVIFLSPIQHLGVIPQELADVPQEVTDYLKAVPTVWDSSRLIDGYPGKYAVFERVSKGRTFVAGVNGGKEAYTAKYTYQGTQHAVFTLIADGDRGLTTEEVTLIPGGEFSLELAPAAGFVLYTKYNP